MEKILLTGGVGYIGSHIAVALVEHGYTPVLLDNLSRSDDSIPDRINELCGFNVPLYKTDCRDRDGLRKLLDAEGGVDGVIHLAAYKSVGESVKIPLTYFDNNISAMTALLDIMVSERLNNLVFSSSCTVYGVPDHREVTEKTPFGNAFSPYGFTKQACERLMADVARSEPWMRQVSLRYFNPIGAHPSGKLGELPGGVPDNLIPYVTQTAAGQRDHITIFGSDYDTPDGTCVRDYVHVCDVAEAHVRALNYVSESDIALDTFNIGTGRGHSVKEIIDIFRRVNKTEVRSEEGPRRPGDVDAIYANVDKASATLGWTSKYTVEEALKHAWEWQKSL
ncbi:MAG: UDP-glucose 4-epimerase GalE [Cryomorphaceae bacterium]|nr:UDP-glucose 4-epimerase GalE [Flavobacteriales bacterium]